MVIEHTEEELLKAFEIMIQHVSRNGQITDHFYSGDKDTRILAASNVFRKNNIPDLYDLTDKQRNYYTELYRNDIEVIYDELVKFGKEEFEKIRIVEEYLKKEFDSYSNIEINKDSSDSLKNKGIDILDDKDISDDYESELPF